MEKNPVISVHSDGVLIDNEVVPLYSGSVHYWRHEKENWRSILEGVREMGFRFVETYIPWNVHEITHGNYDFGKLDPKKDLVSFIRLCQEVGLFLIIRPGPHINAELPEFGFPRRVVDNPAIQARTTSGMPAVLPIVSNPFPIPSYASEEFYDEVGTYFDALLPLITPFLYPAGPIVAYQADNENSSFFRLQCYDLDYHPDSIRLYQEFLKTQYKSIRVLNLTYQSQYLDFSYIDPPRVFNANKKNDLPYYLDWAAYQEYYIIYGISRVAEMLANRGLRGIPCFHNFPTFYASQPLNITKLEKIIDIAGVDAYPQLSQYEDLKLGMIHASTMSRLPFIPEFMSGAWAWYRPISVHDEQFITQVAFMYGIRAINYYMLAERDRWMGCPIKRDGAHREEYFNFYTRWNALLNDYSWHTLRPERKILVLTSRTYDQLKYVSREATFPQQWILSTYTKLPENLFESERKLGERDNIAASAPAWVQDMRMSLEELGINYAIADSDISIEKLKEYDLVIAATFDWAEEAYLQKLENYAVAGGKLLIGPRYPKENLEGEKLPFWDRIAKDCQISPDVVTPRELVNHKKNLIINHPFSQLKADKGVITFFNIEFPVIDDVNLLSEDYPSGSTFLKKVLQDAGINPTWRCDNPIIDVNILANTDSRILCVCNPSNSIQKTTLTVDGISSWKRIEICEEQKTERSDLIMAKSLNTTLAPWSVQIWEVK